MLRMIVKKFPKIATIEGKRNERITIPVIRPVVLATLALCFA